MTGIKFKGSIFTKLVHRTLFFLLCGFCPSEFFQHKIFNETTYAHNLLSTFKCLGSGYMRVIYNLNVLYFFFLLTIFSY